LATVFKSFTKINGSRTCDSAKNL